MYRSFKAGDVSMRYGFDEFIYLQYHAYVYNNSIPYKCMFLLVIHTYQYRVDVFCIKYHSCDVGCTVYGDDEWMLERIQIGFIHSGII